MKNSEFAAKKSSPSEGKTQKNTPDHAFLRIIVTARPHQYQTAEWAGVGALMEKPLNIPALLATIRDLLEEPLHRRLMRLSGRKHSTRYGRPVDEPSNRVSS